MRAIIKDNFKSRTVKLTRFWLSRLGAIAFGVGLSLLLVEGLLRIPAIAYNLPQNVQASLREVRITPWTDERIVPAVLIRHENYFGISIRPGVIDRPQLANTGVQFNVTTLNWLDPNSHMGFRVDRPDWEPIWPVDVVMVGDSYTFCFVQYADCYTEILAHDYQLSVVNLGIPATGSVSHQRVLDTFGTPYQPRIVIWQWYGNDFYDDYDLVISSGEAKTQTDGVSNGVSPKSPLEKWLQKYSALYTLIRTVLSVPNPSDAQRHIQSGDLDLYYGKADIQAFSSFSNKPVALGWPMSQEAILAVRDSTAKQGVSLVIVLIPTKEEVYQKLLEPQLGKEWFTDVSEGRLKLLAFCEEHNLSCLDVTGELSSHADQGEQVYWSTDSHLNALGNRIVADAIWRYIDEKRLLPPP